MYLSWAFCTALVSFLLCRYIVFEGEEGQDAGGLLREWYMIISREMFNPMYALFRTSPGDRVTYTINPSSHCNPNHLSYFKFVGRIVAKAVYDNRLLECYFTRSFYKHILGKSVRWGNGAFLILSSPLGVRSFYPIPVLLLPPPTRNPVCVSRYTDMESEDYHFYQGLVYLLENDVSTLGYDLTFSTEVGQEILTTAHHSQSRRPMLRSPWNCHWEISHNSKDTSP